MPCYLWRLGLRCGASAGDLLRLGVAIIRLLCPIRFGSICAATLLPASGDNDARVPPFPQRGPSLRNTPSLAGATVGQRSSRTACSGRNGVPARSFTAGQDRHTAIGSSLASHTQTFGCRARSVTSTGLGARALAGRCSWAALRAIPGKAEGAVGVPTFSSLHRRGWPWLPRRGP